MRATQTLPENYHPIKTIDLSKDKRLLVILNLASLPLFFFFGWLFFQPIIWLRQVDLFEMAAQTQISSISDWIGLGGIIIGLSAVQILLHELIHGVFFWWYTRSRPRFAIRLTYAYAAAPDWFLPRNEYLVTSLAPFVVMSVAGVLLFAAAPAVWLLPTWFAITLNAGGSIGDLLVAVWLLRQPVTCLAQDRGDAVTLYVK